jgi:hypothetical protein
VERELEVGRSESGFLDRRRGMEGDIGGGAARGLHPTSAAWLWKRTSVLRVVESTNSASEASATTSF